MTEFLKGTTFFVFGVMLSPLALGMLVPLGLYDLTQHEVVTIAGTAIYLVTWVVSWETMKRRKWHYYI